MESNYVTAGISVDHKRPQLDLMRVNCKERTGLVPESPASRFDIHPKDPNRAEQNLPSPPMLRLSLQNFELNKPLFFIPHPHARLYHQQMDQDSSKKMSPRCPTFSLGLVKGDTATGMHEA